MTRAMLFLTAALILPTTSARADVPSSPKGIAADPNERVCEKIVVTGSRLSTRKICATRAEWEAKRQQDKDLVDQIQRSPNPPCSTVNTHSGAPSC